MNIKILGSSLLLFPLGAFALDCPSGEKMNVSGSVMTYNVSQTQQQGRMQLILEEHEENEVEIEFNRLGEINGYINVPASDPSVGLTVLDHQIDFYRENKDGTRTLKHSISTVNDRAQTVGFYKFENGVPCGLNIVENISEISFGTGKFKEATADITAVGTVSICTSDLGDMVPDNLFTLSGEICLKDD